MSGETSELKVKVTTTADNTGLDQTAQAATKAASALSAIDTSGAKAKEGTKKAEEGNKGLVESFGALGHRGSDAKEAVEGVARAAQGGAGAIFGVSNAVRGLLGVIRGGIAGSGPIGLFVTILGTLGGLFLVIKERIGEMGKGMDDSKKKSEDLAAAVANIKDDAAKAVALQIKRISDNTQDTIDKLTLLKNALDHLNENRLAIEQSSIKNSETLTPAQKEQKDFEAQNRARAAKLDTTVKQIDASIAQKEKESEKTISELQAAVKNERALRDERADLVRQRSNANEILNAPSVVKFDDFGNDITDPAEAKKQQRAADDARFKLRDIEQRLGLLDGEPGKDNGLIAAAKESTATLSKQASDTNLANRGDASTGKVGEIEKLQQAKEIAQADFQKDQIVANNDFAEKQRTAQKKLTDEQTALATESESLKDKNIRAGLGGDPASNARLLEISKRQSEITTELGQRATSLPGVKDSTAKLTKEFGGEFAKTIAQTKPEIVPTRGNGSTAPGTIKGPDGVVRTIDRGAGKRGITDSQGNDVAIDNLTKPGQGKATRTTDPEVLQAIQSLPEQIASAVAKAIGGSSGAGGGGPSPKDTVDAINKNGKSTENLHGKMVDALNAGSARNDSTAKKVDTLARAERARADRS